MKDPKIQELMEKAVTWAVEAGELTLATFGGVVGGDHKADGTPVTEADRKAEQLLRERISTEYPDHGILGEEFGETNLGSAVRWILDPIDGTLSFSRGVPLYGVLIGIELDGEPVVGVAHFPALRETVHAGRGLGCRWQGEPCRVSEVSELSKALLLTTDPENTLNLLGDSWRSAARKAYFARSWGDCYGHILVATGRAEMMVDPVLNPWDAAPLLTILTEAGGVFTDLAGNETLHGGSGISSNGRLQADLFKPRIDSPAP